MAVDFPNTPTVGQVFTSGGVAYVWDGVKWEAQSSATQFGTGVPIWLTVGDTPPPSPQPGAMWFDTTGMQMYLYYQDPDSIEWVPVSNQGSPIGTTGTLGNFGRNYVHNSKFYINQRGGPWTCTGTYVYTLDRWLGGSVTDTLTVYQYTMSDADRGQIGDESAEFGLQANFTGTSGAAAYTVLQHWIEDVRRLSGKTVTVSFWAWPSGTMNVGVELQQYFGSTSGVSPAYFGPGQSVALTPTLWRRYAVTFTLPSVAGKTTDGNSCTGINFWMSSGANNATNAGNPGVQSGQVFFWGVQLELGSTASAFQPIDPVLDLQQCQRFYCVQTGYLYGFANTPNEVVVLWTFPVPMRITPNILLLTTTPYAECKPYVSGFTASGATLRALHSTNAIGFDIAVDGFTGLTQDQFSSLGQGCLAASADL